MGDALDAYRDIVCRANGHTHGDKGLLDCLLAEHARQKAAKQEGTQVQAA